MSLESKFGYCMITLNLNIAIYMWVARKYRQVDRQMDDLWTDKMIQLLDAPGEHLRPGA